VERDPEDEPDTRAQGGNAAEGEDSVPSREQRRTAPEETVESFQ
jgi:hypothetical protein